MHEAIIFLHNGTNGDKTKIACGRMRNEVDGDWNTQTALDKNKVLQHNNTMVESLMQIIRHIQDTSCKICWQYTT